jgi:hypothetical protein
MKLINVLFTVVFGGVNNRNVRFTIKPIHAEMSEFVLY